MTAGPRHSKLQKLLLGLATFFLAMCSISPVVAASAPALLWKKSSSLCLRDAPAVGDDGYLYAWGGPSCANGQGAGAAAFDPTDGSILWGPVTPSDCTALIQVPSIGANGLVYVEGDGNECGNGKLVAIRNTDGSIAWEQANSSTFPRQVPALDESLNAVYFGSATVSSFDMSSGTPNWTAGGGYYIGEGGMAIDSAGNVYLGTNNGAPRNTAQVLSYTAQGALRWTRSFASNQPIVEAITSGDTLLLFDNFNNVLLAWDNSGNDLWQAAGLHSPVVDQFGTIYATSSTGTDPWNPPYAVVALTPSGTEIWRTTIATTLPLQTEFVDSSGHVYVNGDNILYAVNTADGSIAWSFATDGTIDRCAVLTLRGQIFLGDTSSQLYLLDTSLDYAPSPWPVALYGNRRHTGKVGPLPVVNTPTAKDTPTVTSTPTVTATGTPTDTPTSTPTNTPTATPAPTDTASPTPTNTPDVPPVCGTPRATCRAPIESGTARFIVGNGRLARLHRVSLTWNHGTATTTADFGDPVNSTSYSFCVWDEGGGAPALIFSGVARGHTDCGGSGPCWRQTRTGFLYRNMYSRTPVEGLRNLRLVAGIDGRARIRVRYKGKQVQVPPLPLQQDPKVIVQLLNSVGGCWGAEFSTPARVNTTRRFVDVSD